jgi:hypothetical protein
MNTITIVDIQTIISDIEQNESKASALFNNWIYSNDPFEEPSWTIELCFLQLLTASETLNLPEFRRLVEVEYLKLKNSADGFAASTDGPDGEPYSAVLATVRLFLSTLKGFLPPDEHKTIRKDVDQIIKDIHYVITDTTIFPAVPRNERDVHLRIEAVLKCVFPDLKHKPVLTKQVKNFEPDTGISSIATLIEYKFLSRAEDVGPMADELLADTRGYHSSEWDNFLYVIYETSRFKKQDEWNQLMRDSGVPPNTKVIVLSGVPPSIAGFRKSKKNSKRSRPTASKSRKSKKTK